MPLPPSSDDLNMGDVFAYIDDHQLMFLDRLFAYLRQPSISASGVGIGETATHIAAELAQLGLTTRLVPTAGWPVVVATSAATPAAMNVMFYGHYDVQPPEPLDAWQSPPFAPAIRDGRIFARGVGDNKGQHFANILALESLLACRGALPCNVTVVLEGEEEVGSPHMPAFVHEHGAELAADLVVISDGPVHESGQSQITFGVRGIISFDLHARGANRDLHSGNWGGVVPNPLWTLVHLLATMKNARGDVTITGFYDDVAPQTAMERAALDALPLDVAAILHDLDLAALDEPCERGFYARLSAWPTFTINGLHGGYDGPGSKTVLPHEAVARCDMRLVDGQTAEDCFAKVEAHVRHHAPSVRVVRQGGMDPSKTPLESPFVPALRRGIVAAQGQEPLLVPAMGGSLPEYVFTKTLGLPVFGVPYANADEANHAPNENLEVARFIMGIKTGAALLVALSQGAAHPTRQAT